MGAGAGAAYCVLESAGWKRIGLSDLSPFLQVGVRGAWRGEGEGEGPTCGKVSGGGARSTSQSQHQDGQPHGLAFGVQRNSTAATLAGDRQVGVGLSALILWRALAPHRG